MRKAVYWTALERELFSIAYKDICAKQPTLGRFKKIAEAQKALDVSLRRSPYDFGRIKWFIELTNSIAKEQLVNGAAAGHQEQPQKSTRTGRRPVWTAEEKDLFLDRFKKLASDFPDTPLRVKIRNALEALPKEKRLGVDGIARSYWFNDWKKDFDDRRVESLEPCESVTSPVDSVEIRKESVAESSPAAPAEKAPDVVEEVAQQRLVEVHQTTISPTIIDEIAKKVIAGLRPELELMLANGFASSQFIATVENAAITYLSAYKPEEKKLVPTTAAAVINQAKGERKRVVLIHLLPIQFQEIKKQFDDLFDLVAWDANSCGMAALKSHAKNAYRIYSMTGKMDHSTDRYLSVHAKGRYFRFNGSTSTLIPMLEELYCTL